MVHPIAACDLVLKALLSLTKVHFSFPGVGITSACSLYVETVLLLIQTIINKTSLHSVINLAQPTFITQCPFLHLFHLFSHSPERNCLLRCKVIQKSNVE